MVVLIVFGSTIVDERKVRKKKRERERERESVRVTCHLSLSGEVTGPERDCALS